MRGMNNIPWITVRKPWRKRRTSSEHVSSPVWLKKIDGDDIYQREGYRDKPEQNYVKALCVKKSRPH